MRAFNPSPGFGVAWAVQRGLALLACLVSFVALLCGCTSPAEYIRNGFKVGPNYGKPSAAVEPDWIDAADVRVRKPSDDQSKWWTVFQDPVLDQLICLAYQQNLTLREAGFRVLQARAQLGITTSGLFPQMQFARGDHNNLANSQKTANSRFTGGNQFFGQWDFGFNLAWELDFWGRFRRAVESSSASLDASVEEYDDVLVTLLADVATSYVQMRTTERRIQFAQKNVELQRETVSLLLSRKDVDINGELNADQARSVLAQTEAAIPELEIVLRQTTNQLCILLGIPPEELRTRLGPAPIPTAPPDVAVGIPAELLRRRPDIRRAERQAAAQCALIGVAESEFYPHIALSGTLGYSAEQFKDLFRSQAMAGNFGPTFQWNLLNYGRILNNVRLQDAKFQELAVVYQNTVLNAQREAENGLVVFLKAQQRAKSQAESVQFADAAKKVVLAKYKLGTINIAQLIQIEQNLVLQQDTLAVAQGEIATGLIQVYKALGGGWQIRFTGCDPQSRVAVLGAPRDADHEMPPPRPMPPPAAPSPMAPNRKER